MCPVADDPDKVVPRIGGGVPITCDRCEKELPDAEKEPVLCDECAESICGLMGYIAEEVERTTL